MKFSKMIFCFLCTILIFLNSTSFYMATETTDSSEYNSGYDFGIDIFYENRSSMISDSSVVDSIGLPEVANSSDYWVLIYYSTYDSYYLYYGDELTKPYLSYVYNSGNSLYYIGIGWTVGTNLMVYSEGSWQDKGAQSNESMYSFGRINSKNEFYVENWRFVASNFVLSLENSNGNEYNFFPYSLSVYEPDLGYLRKLEFVKLFLVDSSGTDVDFDTVKYKFKFDRLSSAGIDLTDNCYILHSIVLEVHYNDSCKVDVSCPEVVARVWNASDLYIEYTSEDLEDFLIGSGFTGLSSVTSNFYHVNLVHYFQICKYSNDGTYAYGNKLRFSECENVYTVETPDGEDIGSSGIVESGSGSGTTYEDAELNIGNVVIEDGYKSENIVADVESLLGFIGAFPAVIAALLSFLPVQYQILIYVSIAVAIVLVVWKVARG